MLNGSEGRPQPETPTTAEDIHRQQRAFLALRALDLEAENILLHQEVQRLKARIEELETAVPKVPVNKSVHHPPGVGSM